MIAFYIAASSVDVLILNMRFLNEKLIKLQRPECHSQSVSQSQGMRRMCAAYALHVRRHGLRLQNV